MDKDQFEQLLQSACEKSTLEATGPDVAVAEAAIKPDHNQAVEDWRGK